VATAPLKKFTVRWGDLDANRHLGNTSYSALMNDTRMSFLRSHGYDQKWLEVHEIGPVILSEEFHYLREIFGGEEVTVDLELLGHTEDFQFAKWCHSLFNQQGKQAAYSEVLLTWFDLKKRAIISPSQELIDLMLTIPKAERFRILAPGDIKSSKIPKKNLVSL